MERKPVLPTAELYHVMKNVRNESPMTMFALITRNFLRKYFTLSYHETEEFEYGVSKNEPVVLEAWKRKDTRRKGVSVKIALTQEESDIMREITILLDELQGNK